MSENASNLGESSALLDQYKFLQIHSDALVPRTRVKSILIAAAFGGAIALAIIFTGIVAGMAKVPATMAPYIPFLVMVLIFSIFFAWRTSWRNRYTRFLDSFTTSPHEFVTIAVEKLRRQPPMLSIVGINVLARQFLRRDWLGYSIQIVPPTDRSSPVPLTVPIEPLALDESDEAFLQLSGSGSPSAARNAAKKLEQSESTRRFRRVFTFVGFAIAMFALQAIPQIIDFVRTGRPSFLLLWFVFLVGVMILQATMGFDRTRSRLLAVNGGLLHRKSKWFGPTNVHLFSRDNSVLFVFRMNKKHWWWAALAPGFEKGVWMFGTTAEAEMALRAWLSPLPPPEIARLSDFA